MYSFVSLSCGTTNKDCIKPSARFLTCQWSTVLTLKSKTRSYYTATQPEYTYNILLESKHSKAASWFCHFPDQDAGSLSF